MALVYPTQEELRDYKDVLLRMDFLYLPPIDDKWACDMHAMFELVQMLPECADSFETASANIFFKIIKNHCRHDGNKRSAICCLIFFSLLNDRRINLTPQEIEAMALNVAASSGNTGSEFVPKLRSIFEQKVALRSSV